MNEEKLKSQQTETNKEIDNRKKELQTLQGDQEKRTMDVNEKKRDLTVILISSPSLWLFPMFQNIEEELKGFKMRRERIQQEIQDVEASKRNHLNRFGAGVPPLLDLLAKHARYFDQRPIGPIGILVLCRRMHDDPPFQATTSRCETRSGLRRWNSS